MENIRKIIIQRIKDFKSYDLKLLIKLNIQEINENKKNSLKNICCKYKLSNPILINIEIKIYEDNNILIKEKFENFELFISDITDIFKRKEEKTPNSSYFGSTSSIGLQSISINIDISGETDLKNHIIKSISLILEDIIKENMNSNNNKKYIDISKNNIFYLYFITPMPLEDYIKHLMKYSNMNISTLIIAII